MAKSMAADRGAEFNQFMSAASQMAQLYSDESREVLRRREAHDFHFVQIVHEWAELMFTGKTLRKVVLKHAASIVHHNDVPPDLAEQWINEARELNRDCQSLRALLDEFQDVTEPLKSFDDNHASTIMHFWDEWMTLTDSVAETMEDLAETLALAAHKPFRERVTTELEAAGLA